MKCISAHNLMQLPRPYCDCHPHIIKNLSLRSFTQNHLGLATDFFRRLNKGQKIALEISRNMCQL